ncbi:MAG: Swarming motility protein SwrC [Firmicutes bacterium ADurb.Bin153]|nr:MAG: Swarming motility protein SwrC [Firmicutes bacterium ADurb.Bin153]
MNLTLLSLKRPVTVIMTIAAVILFGLISFDRLSLEMLPNMDFPMLAVVTIYPNADAETVESTVTVPIETQVRSIRGVRNVNSTSMENASMIMMEFNWGTDLGEAENLVKSELEANSMFMPSGINDTFIMRMNPDSIAMMMLSIGSEGEPVDVTAQIKRDILPELNRVPGVAGIILSGGTDKVITVEYDHDKLVENSVNPSLLQLLIQYQNMTIPAGAIVDEGVRYQTKVGSKLNSIEDIEGLVIGLKKKQEENGGSGILGLSMLMPSFLTVGDIAEVKVEGQTAEGFMRINGKTSVVLNIYKQSGYNTVTVAKDVKNKIKELNDKYPQISLGYIFDQSEYISQSIKDLGSSAVQGAFLAIAILYVYLRSLKATFVIGISIPLSIVITFAIMLATKLELNLLTLGGLALGIGMLVDNSIVVLESIYRRREMGDSMFDAALYGTKEVSLAILGSTLTTLGAFVPVVFLSSLAGQIFKDLALTVTYSLAASLFVALTIVPLASMKLNLRAPKGVQTEADETVLTEKQKYERYGKKKSMMIYENSMLWGLKHRWYIVGIMIIAVALSLFGYSRLDQEFLPKMDMGRIDVTITLPAGSPTEKTNEASKEFEAMLLEMPWVESVSAQVGSLGTGSYLALVMSNAANESTLGVNIKQDKNKVSMNEAVVKVREASDKIKADYPGTSVTVDTSGFGSLLGGFIDIFGTKITVSVTGSNEEGINQAATELTERLRKTSGIVDVVSDLENTQPVMLLDVNRTRALMGGLTVAQIGLGVRTSSLGTTVTNINVEGESVPVIVKPSKGGEQTLASMMDLPVSSTISIMSMMGDSSSAAASAASSLMSPVTDVYVNKVATPVPQTGPVQLIRRNGERIVQVTYAFDESLKVGNAQKIAEKIAADMQLQDGVDINFGGVSELLTEGFGDLYFAAGLALFIVYFVMAVQFESFMYPLIILFTVPLALIGAVALLLISGTGVGISALIGAIILVGVVVNNGIVLVDFILQMRAKGFSTNEAIVISARSRLRPILMTALTTILGLVPIALATGKGSEISKGMALTVIGGLTASTYLTLVVVPVMFKIFDDFSNWIGRRKEVKVNEV